MWLSFGIALVLVNLIAWLGEQLSGFHVPMILRLALVLGIVVGTIIFAGAFALVNTIDQERPLTGHGKDTLQSRPANQSPPTQSAKPDPVEKPQETEQ